MEKGLFRKDEGQIAQDASNQDMHLKELTDDLRIKELESEIERLQDQLNEFLVVRDLAILRKAQEK